MAAERKQGVPPRRENAVAAIETLARKALDLGAVQAKVISPSDVRAGSWVRWKCRFGCGGYGSSLMCPPHTPRPEETRRMLDEYTSAVLFEAPRGEAKRIAADLEREAFLGGHYNTFGLGSGPCRLRDECAFDEGWRYPRETRPSMEACGIDVDATARRHGFPIEVCRTHDDPQHYYGLVLVE